MTTTLRIALIALTILSIGYSVIVSKQVRQARKDLTELEEKVEADRIAAEAVLFNAISAYRETLAEKDKEIADLTARDADLTNLINTNRTRQDARRTQITTLSGDTLLHELRGVFARRGQYP